MVSKAPSAPNKPEHGGYCQPLHLAGVVRKDAEPESFALLNYVLVK